jgi:S-DNA-T family DNA segregation ATPase FtsK/SpoIIIE
MENRYKIVIAGKKLYKEIELTANTPKVRVGTSVDCDVWLHKERFFEQVELIFTNNGNDWSVTCSENLFFDIGDVRKLLTKILKHGDSFLLRYQDSNNEIFSLCFTLDFDYEKKTYNQEIEISHMSKISIGGNDCDITLHDQFIGNDNLTLQQNGNKYTVVDNNTKYGLYVNGAKINKSKEIQNFDFISIVGHSFYLSGGKLYTSDKAVVNNQSLRYRKLEQYSTCFEYPKFNRSTRVQYVLPEDEIKIQQPQPKLSKPKRNILLSLIPTITMLGMTILIRGVMGGGGTFVIYSAVSIGLGAIMSVVNFILEGKEFKKNSAKREEDYKKYIAEKEKLIQETRANELRIRNLIYESFQNNISEACSFGKRLFERGAADKDFLDIYLGLGTVDASSKVTFTKQEFVDMEDPISMLPEQIAQKYEKIYNAPIISRFNSSCGIGIVGNKESLNNILRNMTLDIAIRHFFNEVKLYFMFNEVDINEFSWVKWLRHVKNDSIDIRNIMCDEESRNVLLEFLYKELSRREELSKSRERDDVGFSEYYVVFVMDSSEIQKHPVSRYFEKCNDYGFTFVFFVGHEELLPCGCTEIIRLNDSAHAVLQSENGDIQSTFDYQPYSNQAAESIALKIGAIVVEEVSLESELTKNITLYELLKIMSVDDLDLQKRWDDSKVFKSMAAPLGVKTKNEIVALDISDKASAHGPHGLVAGTTGSGKSEILQTYVLSMALLFHPYDVGFVIIDFKGGGMANQFKDLPHMVGTITNIDGREINRSLLSIKAELVKRQSLFSKSKVNHINDYIKLYKKGAVTEPLPHLIMIVDEFAELKSEFPDFMKEIISAARIGRTLGVHLILATQKPAGVVDNQIWSNSKFKLCLKVQTKEDSNEIIKTPLAAEIVEPGRAYFQVGNNEIFELFQSAYSGAKVLSDGELTGNVYSIFSLNEWGKKTLVYTNKKKSSSEESKNQLQTVVEYIGNYVASNKIARLPGICLPSLSDVIRTKALKIELDNSLNITVPIGIYDDPVQQKQDEVVLELSKDNTYIVGSAQTGKTVMLQTIVYGLIKKYDPSQVNIYLVDCGSMVLKIFENSAHVGGVVLSNEDEKCKNLFRLLNTIVNERKTILSSKGVGNYSAYLDAGFTDMPMVIVAIDNMAAFKEYFPNQAEDLNVLSREAQGVGIAFILTTAISNAINSRTQANFGKKLTLNCNDINEYGNVFGHCRETPKENPGRGFMMLEKRILEYQCAIFGESEKEADRSQELKQYIENRNKKCSCKAYPIPEVPDKLFLSEEMASNTTAFRSKGFIPIGMDFDTVAYSVLNITSESSLSLVGHNASQERFLINFLRLLKDTIIFHNIEATIIDDRQKSLKDSEKYGFVRRYTSDISEGVALVNDFCEEVQKRKDEDRDQTDTPYLLLIINNNEVFKRVSGEKSDSKALADLVKSASAGGAFVVLANVDNQPVGFNSSEAVKAIKDERNAILFAPLSENKLFEITGRSRLDSSFDRSIGYRFDGGSQTKIKIFE